MDAKYSVETLHGCVIVRGAVPVTAMVPLLQGQGEDDVMDFSLADFTGANMVFGTRANLRALRDSGELPPSPVRVADADAARKAGHPAAVVAWLWRGERGMSSKAMCKAIYGLPSDRKRDDAHPLDADDFGRCINFLEAVPAEQRPDALAKVAALSSTWGGIVAEWDQLAQWTRNPDTWKRVHERIGEIAEAAQDNDASRPRG